MQNRLKIELRQKQLYLDQDPLQPVVLQCNLDGTVNYIAGTVPQGMYTDFTQHVSGLGDINFKWEAVTEDFTEGESKETNEFGSNYSKGLSAELGFFGPAFFFIHDWLMLQDCQTLNAIEARITDTACGKNYRVFEIKTDNIEYMPNDEPCLITIPLREADAAIHVLQKTTIEDNWQNWFNKDGTSTKDHPTFGIIIEKKPGFILAIMMVLVYIAGMLSAGLLTAFSDGTRWIRRVLGVCYFCPSPLIRDIFINFCTKYGFTMDTIFDDEPENEYRDVCLFFPVERNDKNFDDFTAPSTKYIYQNRTGIPVSRFLDQLKKVFNAEWYITPNNTLVFKQKSFFDSEVPIIDFTLPGAPKLHKLKYTFSGAKKPAYGNYQYQIDPQDTCSNELKQRYNAIVDYDGPADNPMLEGNITKNFEFAGTAFHNDGSTEEFLEENVRVARLVAIGAVLVGFGSLFIAANPVTAGIVAGLLALGYNVTNNYVNDFFDNPEINGMVRLASRQINTPRLLMWDRATPMNKAKVVYVEDPAPNLKYNTSGNDYYDEHPAFDAPAGYFGTDVTRIYNYPMYVEEQFVGNLFDRFHEYDNPFNNPVSNQTWAANVDICCEMLDTFGVWENDFAKVGSVVVLENRNGRIIKGRITHIEPTYKEGIIALTGKVIK
jgi:hypothetical protein